MDWHYRGADAVEYCLKRVYDIGPEDKNSYRISNGIRYIPTEKDSVISFNEAYLKKLYETQSEEETMNYIKQIQPDRYFEQQLHLRATIRSILVIEKAKKKCQLLRHY